MKKVYVSVLGGISMCRDRMERRGFMAEDQSELIEETKAASRQKSMTCAENFTQIIL